MDQDTEIEEVDEALQSKQSLHSALYGPYIYRKVSNYNAVYIT